LHATITQRGVTGSLIPVAGGAGSVEVTLAVALHAAGLPAAAAAAAALLSRIIGYWAPALAGLPALGLLAATRHDHHAETVARHQDQHLPVRPPTLRPAGAVAPVGGVALGAALACVTAAAVGGRSFFPAPELRFRTFAGVGFNQGPSRPCMCDVGWVNWGIDYFAPIT
jgi:hypothetical protein